MRDSGKDKDSRTSNESVTGFDGRPDGEIVCERINGWREKACKANVDINVGEVALSGATKVTSLGARRKLLQRAESWQSW